MSPTLRNPLHARKATKTWPDLGAIGLSWLLIAIHFIALASLALVLTSAPALSAEDDLTCGARNLVGELQKSDPAAYEKLMAEADKIKNSRYRFWKLEKDGNPPNWLLGTMHVSDPRVTQLPEAARSAYGNADTIIVESDEILDQQAAAARLFAKPDLMMFTGDKSIKDYLSEDDRKVLEEALSKRGIPLGSIIKMKPYIVASMISLSTCELSRKASGKPFLDMKLALDGQSAGKKVVGVETLAEQIQAMADLPMDFHIKSLVDSARYPQYTADMMETTLQLYLQGRIGMVFPAGAYFAPEKSAGDFESMALFEKKLITDRNHNMADRAEPVLAAGNVFMAVGALHLIGDEGLVALFRQKGYNVTPID